MKAKSPGVRTKALRGHAAAALRRLADRVLAPEVYDLCLYVAGSTPRSAEAITNLRSLCEEFLPGRYRLTVIDIYQQPESAFQDQIIAAPTLVKRSPAPIRRIIGNLAGRERTMAALNVGPQFAGGK